MALIGGFLLYRGIDALRISGWGFITESQWAPDMGGAFGIASLLPYTFSIAFVALFIAVPISIATALFITEYAPRRIRRFLTATIDLLAAVPSLIYGLWGLFYLQPRIITLSKWLADNLGFVPFFKVNDDFDVAWCLPVFNIRGRCHRVADGHPHLYFGDARGIWSSTSG